MYLLLGMPAAEASGWVLSAATEAFETMEQLIVRLKDLYKAPG